MGGHRRRLGRNRRFLLGHFHAMFTPAVMRCDNDPGFTSEVMAAFRTMLGVKTMDYSAPDDPTHHSVVERRNKVMEKLLDVGISKGDLNTAADLDMYCATAAAACNLEYTQNGHTVLEYLTGEIPRTHKDLVTGRRY